MGGGPGAQDTAFTCPPPICQDEGSQGTDAPTPGNAENEPPEKEGLSPPRRTPAPPEPGSPAPAWPQRACSKGKTVDSGCGRVG